MGYLGFATLLSGAPVLDSIIGTWIYALYESIGSFGWTVVIFTIILKCVVSPLDIWQKIVMRKNQLAMKKMKPELEKLQKQYANDKALYSQKQMQLYKKHKYSTLGACVPMIATLVIFIVIFAGFTKMVKYSNEKNYFNLKTVYNQTIDDYEEECKKEGKTATQAEGEGLAEKAVLAYYDKNIAGEIKFLWIDNIFMPDTWVKPVPNVETFTGSGIGKLNISADYKEYNKIMKPIMEKHNTSDWNGYLILPILAFILNFFTAKFMQSGQPDMAAMSGNSEMQKATGTQMKVMKWMMPVMMLVFSMLYSSAFTLYMLTSALFTGLFQLITNLVFKIKDKKDEEKRLNTSYRA